MPLAVELFWLNSLDSLYLDIKKVQTNFELVELFPTSFVVTVKGARDTGVCVCGCVMVCGAVCVMCVCVCGAVCVMSV